MKKRVKSRISSSKNTKRKIDIPVLIFVLALVFVVYSGIMGLFDKALTPSNNLPIANTGDLASYSNPANMLLAGIIIIIFFIIVILFLNIKVKKKKKR
jgi:hypothetical protein